MKTVAKSTLPTHYVRLNDDQAEAIARRRQRRSERAQVTPALQICNATSRATYTGQELRPYDGRPGSLDHLDIPSRAGNRLLYRSRQGIQTIHEARIGASAA